MTTLGFSLQARIASPSGLRELCLKTEKTLVSKLSNKS
jgi:hypothetical protein